MIIVPLHALLVVWRKQPVDEGGANLSALLTEGFGVDREGVCHQVRVRLDAPELTLLRSKIQTNIPDDARRHVTSRNYQERSSD